MPSAQIGRHRLNYDLQGPDGGEVIVFINGLTQSNTAWLAHQQRLNKRGYRVLTYDTLGQGLSSKPVLAIPLDEHARVLADLLDVLGIERAFVAGISFGGLVALRFAIAYPKRVLGLIPISTFCEMPQQLMAIGRVFHMAISQVGFPMVQAMLLPMNFSSQWIDQAKALIPEMARKSYAINDPYAIQNLMESLNTFTPFADELGKISCPTLILNGEFDYLTPRVCHETLRQGIRKSRLVIVQHGYHAITLEFPDLTARLTDAFMTDVLVGTWPGDQSVWVAADEFGPEVVGRRCYGDHLRAIQPIDDQLAAVAEEWRTGGAKPKPAAAAPSAKTAPAPKAAVKPVVKKAPASKPSTAAATKPVVATKPKTQPKSPPKPKAAAKAIPKAATKALTKAPTSPSRKAK